MKSPVRQRSDPVESNRSPTGSRHSSISPRRQQALSPRDPSGKRVTQHGARLIVDEVASLTTMAEAAAAANAAAAKRRRGFGMSSPPQSPGPASPHERVTSADTLDGLIQQVDHRGDDKYRSVVAAVLSPNDDTVILSDPSSATGTNLTMSTQYDDEEDDDDDEYDEEEYDEEEHPFGYEEMNDEVRITMDHTLQQVRSLSPCSPSPTMQQRSVLTTSPPFLNKHHKTTRGAAASSSMESSKQQQQKLRKQKARSATSPTAGTAATPRRSGAGGGGNNQPLLPTSDVKSRNLSHHQPLSSALPMVHRTSTLNTMDSGNTNDMYHIFSDDDDGDYWKTKQKVPYLTLLLTAFQVLVLMLQLTLCGVAPLNINPMIGPFPDAFSEWGGKNPYLMMVRRQYWRFLSPAVLHVGVLHLLLNAYCQLETCAFFEREWASLRWFIIYVLSEVGCILVSSVNQPDTFAVGSTGAIMGLLGAKLAQALSHIMFDIQKTEFQIRLEQMSGVMCSLSMLSLLSFVTYIDWSGHVGGLATGFLLGMILFCKPIEDVPSRIVWCLMGLSGLGLGGYVFGRVLWEQQDLLDAELADPCNYFRRLFPEGYLCECLWG